MICSNLHLNINSHVNYQKGKNIIRRKARDMNLRCHTAKIYAIKVAELHDLVEIEQII